MYCFSTCCSSSPHPYQVHQASHTPPSLSKTRSTGTAGITVLHLDAHAALDNQKAFQLLYLRPHTFAAGCHPHCMQWQSPLLQHTSSCGQMAFQITPAILRYGKVIALTPHIHDTKQHHWTLHDMLQLWRDPPLKRHTQVSSAALGLSVGYFLLDICLIIRHYPWVSSLPHHIHGHCLLFASSSSAFHAFQ